MTQGDSKNPGSKNADDLPADGTLLTARGVRSRTGLLSAARNLFKTKGYASVTIADITGKAGRTPGSFYTYFNNKEELLEQLAEEFQTEIIAHMSAIDTVNTEPYELIRELCAVYWKQSRDHAGELGAMFQAAMLDEYFKQRWQEIRADARRKIAAAIVAAQKTGLVSAEIPNPEILASAIGSMMSYFCYTWLIDGGDPDCPALTDEIAIDTMTRVFYRAVFAAPEPGNDKGQMDTESSLE